MIDDHLFLAGRPSLAEFMAVLDGQSAGNKPDPAAVADYWRTASDRVEELQVSEAGAADGHEPLALEPSQQGQAQALTEMPAFREAHARVPNVIARVDLSRLVVAQKHINLAYADDIADRLGDRPSAQAVAELCLPLAPAAGAVGACRAAQDTVVFTSASSDLRLLQQRLVPAEDVSGLPPVNGHNAHLLALVVGTGVNCLSAVHLNGRLVLVNGSHRAFALLRKGLTRVPCVIHNIRRLDELSLVGTDDLLSQLDEVLKSPRPAMLRDFLDPALVVKLPVTRKIRQIRVRYEVEVMDVPLP